MVERWACPMTDNTPQAGEGRERLLAELLADGLDLCVRAQKLDQLLEEIEADHPDNDCAWPITRCYTPHVWAQERYDKDLEEWRDRAATTLVKLGYG